MADGEKQDNFMETGGEARGAGGEGKGRRQEGERPLVERWQGRGAHGILEVPGGTPGRRGVRDQGGGASGGLIVDDACG
jgi:hypothetical protein